MINLAATGFGYIVGKELLGDDDGDRGDEFVAARDADDVVAVGVDIRVAFGCDGDDGGLTCATLLHIADRLLLIRQIRDRHDDRYLRLEEGDRTMLQLGGVIALGVHIGDLFQFEGALEGGGEHVAAPDEEGVVGVGILLRDRLDLRLALQHRRGEFRYARELAHHVAAGCSRETTGAAEHDRHLGHDRDLGRERLGGGNPDLGAGMQVNPTSRFAGDG